MAKIKRGNLDKVIHIRLFEEEYNQLRDIVRLKKDNYNLPKYETESHFIRCAISRLIQEEILLRSNLR